MKVYYGEPEQSGDLGLLHHAHTTITARVLSSSPLDRSASLTPRVLTVKKLLSPVDPRDVRTIRGLGAQFSALPKAERKQPEVPVLFLKPATAICGPEDSIFIPESARGESNDYEVEVCVVMGKQAKDVSVAEAMDYVLGFCTSNDVSGVAFLAPSEQTLTRGGRRRSHRGDSAARDCNGEWASRMTVSRKCRLFRVSD
jgi:2-keto-4-pentenoate hydratase/2-oxohepta-3-ene-1,7-dioic acid hydratase in catechol pathway